MSMEEEIKDEKPEEEEEKKYSTDREGETAAQMSDTEEPKA